MKLNEKLATIQAELKVAKKRRNNFGNYNFRNAEDILEALKPFIIKYKVNFTIDEDELKEIAGIPTFKTTATITDNESANFLSKTALVGVDLNQKGMATPQKFGSASSYGKKYLSDIQHEVLRLSYGLDCDKMPGKAIAEELSFKGPSGYVRVSELKKQAIEKLIDSVDPTQVLDYL